MYKFEGEEKKKRKTLEMELARLSDRLIDLEAENKRLQETIDKLRRDNSSLKVTVMDYQNR